MIQKSPIEGQNGNNTSDIHPLQATGSYFKNMLLDVLAQSTSFEQNYLNGILQDGFRNLERWLEKESPSDFETDCINNLRIALEDGVALLQSPNINIDDVYKIEARVEQYCHSLNERIEVIPKNFFIDKPLKFDWATPEPPKPSIRIQGIDANGNNFEITKKLSKVVNNIDTEGPKGTLSYSTTALTNGDVTVTINLNKDVFNTPAGWTKGAGNTFTKVYTANASETVNFVDVAGNAGSVNVSVTNIDKVGPGSLTFVGTIPSEQGTAYSGLVLSVGKRIGSIASITSSTGGAIGNVGINGSGNIQFDWTTPDAAGSVIRIIGTDEAGNSFNMTVAVSGLEAPNQAPTASDFTESFGSSGFAAIDFSSHISDQDGDELEIVITSNPNNLQIEYDNQTLKTLNVGDVIPTTAYIVGADGYFGIAILEFKVQEKNGNKRQSISATATFTDISN